MKNLSVFFCACLLLAVGPAAGAAALASADSSQEVQRIYDAALKKSAAAFLAPAESELDEARKAGILKELKEAFAALEKQSAPKADKGADAAAREAAVQAKKKREELNKRLDAVLGQVLVIEQGREPGPQALQAYKSRVAEVSRSLRADQEKAWQKFKDRVMPREFSGLSKTQRAQKQQEIQARLAKSALSERAQGFKPKTVDFGVKGAAGEVGGPGAVALGAASGADGKAPDAKAYSQYQATLKAGAVPDKGSPAPARKPGMKERMKTAEGVLEQDAIDHLQQAAKSDNPLEKMKHWGMAAGESTASAVSALYRGDPPTVKRAAVGAAAGVAVVGGAAVLAPGALAAAGVTGASGVGAFGVGMQALSVHGTVGSVGAVVANPGVGTAAMAAVDLIPGKAQAKAVAKLGEVTHATKFLKTGVAEFKGVVMKAAPGMAGRLTAEKSVVAGVAHVDRMMAEVGVKAEKGQFYRGLTGAQTKQVFENGGIIPPHKVMDGASDLAKEIPDATALQRTVQGHVMSNDTRYFTSFTTKLDVAEGYAGGKGGAVLRVTSEKAYPSGKFIGSTGGYEQERLIAGPISKVEVQHPLTKKFVSADSWEGQTILEHYSK